MQLTKTQKERIISRLCSPLHEVAIIARNVALRAYGDALYDFMLGGSELAMTHLEPCPFCGGTDCEIEASSTGYQGRIRCKSCGGCGPFVNWLAPTSSESAVFDKWNDRVLVTYQIKASCNQPSTGEAMESAK